MQADARSAEQFLADLARYLRDQEADFDFELEPAEAHLAADALEIAMRIASGVPAHMMPEVPQPCLAYQIACGDCLQETVQYTGIAFTRGGARALLQEHKGHNHR